MSGDEDASEKKEEKELASVVFSDAKKQFLIESLPPILTLNLKRFVQHGRRLLKNSRHISFPTILDVAPFCTDTCKVRERRPSNLVSIQDRPKLLHIKEWCSLSLSFSLPSPHSI